MRRFVCLAVVLAGCGASRFRTEHVGVAAIGTGSSIALSRGNYEVALRFDVPRAQVVEWTLRCPSVERSGVAGETFENYRTRRLAELQRMVDQDRRRLATVTNAIGAQASGAVRLEGPGGNVRAEARGPSGEVVAEQAIEEIHELPYGDVGAGTYTATLHVQTLEDGACTVSTRASDAIGGTIAVDRVRDLVAEEQERIAAQRTNALEARVRVRTRLVALGADELARERRIAEQERLREAERIARAKRDEEARLRAEADARIRWEAEAPARARKAQLEAERQAKLEAERLALETERRQREAKEAEEQRARMVIVERERLERIRIIEEERRIRITIIERQRAEALRVRGMYIAWLVGTCHADPNRLARLEVERIERSRRIEIEILERERRIEIERIERERRIAIENERVARQRREREQRERQLVMSARMQLAGYLVNRGARMRPPRPSALVEVAGSAPFDGARWEAGTWMWIQAEWRWQWRKGGWVDATQFGDAGGETVVRAPVREVEVVREVETVREVPPPPTTTTQTTTSTGTAVRVPASVTVGVPQGSITIDVKAAPPRVKSSTRRREPARVRDHRR